MIIKRGAGVNWRMWKCAEQGNRDYCREVRISSSMSTSELTCLFCEVPSGEFSGVCRSPDYQLVCRTSHCMPLCRIQLRLAYCKHVDAFVYVASKTWQDSAPKHGDGETIQYIPTWPASIRNVLNSSSGAALRCRILPCFARHDSTAWVQLVSPAHSTSNNYSQWTQLG